MADNTRQSTLHTPSGKVTDLKDVEWTFKGVDTQYLTHGIHSYPARMIPQIPGQLLEYYKSEGVISEGDTVYDPFSGSGTTAVEARLHGLNAEANDINPLACLLSLAKSVPLDLNEVEAAREELLTDLPEQLQAVGQAFSNGELEFDEEPEVRDGWFPEPELQKLWHIRRRIDEIEEEYDGKISRFFRISLSGIIREVSYQRNGEYKRYRLPETEREEHNPEVLELFQSQLNQNIKRMREYSNQVDHSLSTTVHYADSRTATTNDRAVEQNSADIVITSPPYGDHGTTVSYGQFSQDPAIIAGEYDYDEMRNVDKNGLGGSNSDLEPIEDLEEWSESFGKTMDTLREKDGRASEAMDFVRDYYEVMKEVSKILKPGQPVAWVVANRTMSRVTIPTHRITRELCKHLGYVHEVTLPREIPTKTLPWENAPENREGTKGDLMADENIVVMTAPGSNTEAE